MDEERTAPPERKESADRREEEADRREESNTDKEDMEAYINVLETGEYMDVRTLNSADAVTRIDNHRIMVLTSTDLQLEFTDSVGQINTYTFRKK
jgi:hypothetical protein